ncbi:Glycosyl transferase family 2, partial [Candidatus Kryptobacter tengchongensis]
MQVRKRQDKQLISIVIPLYNEVESLPELYDQIKEVVKTNRYNYEIIFVDDGSTDGSLDVLKKIRQNDKNVKIISFRRNYGKSAALAIGFEYAKGDVVITMDADLQDDPHEIPNLLKKLNEGFDLVSGWKKKRYDPLTKTIPSRIFNFVVSTLSGIKIHDFNCGLKAYKKSVTQDIKVYGELHRYLPVLAHWAGYKIGEIVVQHH